MQVGEDEREIEGAEAGRDGGEAGGCGAVGDGVGEMAAVGEQGAHDVEECGDARGWGGGGPILLRVGWGGGTGGGECLTFHGRDSNRMWDVGQWIFPGAFERCGGEVLKPIVRMVGDQSDEVNAGTSKALMRPFRDAASRAEFVNTV